MTRDKFSVNKKGQGTLVTVFVIGMASLALTLGFATLAVHQVQIAENSLSAKKAFYGAQAGIEDVLVRLKNDPGFGQIQEDTDQTLIDLSTTYVATISAISANEKIATSTGRFNNFFKTIEVTLATSSAQTSFTNAVQTGNGGFELLQNSQVTCKSPCTEGNVYSNGDIRGVKKSPLSSASRITGSAWAVGDITKLGVNDSGVRIDKNASASALLECIVIEDQYALAGAPSVNCPLSSGKTYTQTNGSPPVLPLPDFDETYWKQQATNSAIGGGTWEGNCNILSGGADDCTIGTGELGPQRINGSLTIASNKNLIVKGPIWVTTNIDIASNNIIYLDDSFSSIGTVMLADGTVLSNSNVTYDQNGTAIVMMASTMNDGNNCDLPAILTSSNTNNVVFYALNGCVSIANNSAFHGAVVGQKVRVSNNSFIEYDPALSNTIFGASSAGGWYVTGWREVE